VACGQSTGCDVAWTHAVQANRSAGWSYGGCPRWMVDRVSDIDEQSRKRFVRRRVQAWERLLIDDTNPAVQQMGVLTEEAHPAEPRPGLLAALQGGYVLAQVRTTQAHGHRRWTWRSDSPRLLRQRRDTR